MLHEFIVANREVIIDRARARVLTRMGGRPADATANGIPMFLTQLAGALATAAAEPALRLVVAGEDQRTINEVASVNGQDQLKLGFSVAQVVHGYGDVCQIVTELAGELHEVISAGDFHVFNSCLDDAIAGAVTAYVRQREHDLNDEGTERIGFLAHEMRNLLNTAVLSFDVMKRGMVGVAGSTGAVHGRSLAGLRALVERSLAEVRIEAGEPVFARLVVADLVDEIEITAGLEAAGRGVRFHVGPVDHELAIDVDRQLLSSALLNLLQNAFKFTHPGSTVELIIRASSGWVLFDVADECGGIPEGKAEALFLPFSQRGADRTGLGLGLAIALSATQVNAGELSVRNLPGKGCVFTLAVPRAPGPASVTLANAASAEATEAKGSGKQGALPMRTFGSIQ